MLVVGGFNSANTRRLAEVCAELQPRTHHIETAAEINPGWFEGVERVGVTAGASAPESLVSEVIARLESFGAGSVRQLTGVQENVVFPMPKGLGGAR